MNLHPRYRLSQVLTRKRWSDSGSACLFIFYHALVDLLLGNNDSYALTPATVDLFWDGVLLHKLGFPNFS